MSDIVIKAENIGKKYVIGHQIRRGSYTTFRDVMIQNIRNLWNKTKNLVKGKPIIQGDTFEEIWALKDVSFELCRGEAVGIIGRNGAGKSTLLKIFSRITEPSTGRLTIKGRVASLLEVGTGFHPELTGRENIYLNGTILGMTREEIKRKFDEIVAFAEVDKFLDTPVKRYSSGMYVRLAFAVAAHLEPEILVVDEVLAVGDASFQKKCLGKMGNVAKQGRTVLFVSHNMNAIQRLCAQSIWIEEGKLIQIGQSDVVVNAYLSNSSGTYLSGQMELSNWPNRYGSGEARILSARLLNSNQETTTTVYRAGFMAVEFVFENRLMKPLHFSMIVLTESGDKILHLSYHDTPGVDVDSLSGQYRACFSIPELPLCAGNYCIALGIHTENLVPIDVVLDILPFASEDMINSPRPYKTLNKDAFCWTPNHFSVSKLYSN